MNLGNENTDNQAMTGEMFPSTMTAEMNDTQPTEEVAQTAPAVSQKVVVGDRVFNSTEEALAYADGFARSQRTAMSNMAPDPVQDPILQPKKLSQLIFEDPEAALAEVENRAVERVRTEQSLIAEKKSFWEDFYLKHPDLKGSEMLVDAVLNAEQRQGRFKVSFEQAREQAGILAAKARAEVSKIRNVPSGGQALPSSPAIVAGASGASTPRIPASKPASTDFVSELRGMRKRG